MIDLHLHTTASDGLCSPENLVHRAALAGITVMGVTDHDTMAGVAAAAAAAEAVGIGFVPGIEITAVDDGHDVHVLAYCCDPDAPALQTLLAAGRQARVERARDIAARLEAAGAPIDVDALIASAQARGGAIARPQIAAALIAAGHAADVSEAFERFLSPGRPAFVPHRGVPPAEVVRAIVGAGGFASMAHPGDTARDHLIPELCAEGLGAIEAVHSAHDPATVARYLDTAARHDLAVTGGSDYHGEGRRRAECLGRVGLTREQFALLCVRYPDAAQRLARAARV